MLADVARRLETWRIGARFAIAGTAEAACAQARFAAGGVTPAGGGLEAAADLPVAALEAEPHKYTDGQYLRIPDPAGGKGVLVFEVDGTGDDARATTWRIGLPPQVDYVEGCS